MEEYIFHTFLRKLYTCLTEVETTSHEIRIFRKHNNKLDTSGDFSFPLNLSGWEKYMQNTKKDIKITNYIDKFNKNKLVESEFDKLIEETKTWGTIYINKIKLQGSKVNIYINRENALKIIITKILSEKTCYGTFRLKNKPVILEIEDTSLCDNDLTALRITLLKKVADNIFKTTTNTNEEGSDVIYLTNKSISSSTNKKIVCGLVISNKFGKKNTNISVNQFYLKRSADMKLMALHKYGVRVNSEPGWDDFFNHLGHAAATIDLLHVKPNRPVIINEDCSAGTSSKGASFILYNCARLAEIFKKFDKKVANGEIGPLPKLDEVDFKFLNQPEEWELLFVFLMQYATTVESCVQDISDGRLNTHNLCVFLDSICSTFSVYYRRVRVLTESRPHLLPVMYARIYLLKAIQQVMHNALELLDIAPIKQM